MFAENPSLPNSNPSILHLPPIGKSHQRKPRSSPTPPCISTESKATHITQNLSELKAKYDDYTTWLKTSTRQNREPVLTQELLKNSLCQMGIDSVQAEQLVSKCSWYVYQFQKGLRIDTEQKHPIIAIETKNSQQYKTRSKRSRKIKDKIEGTIQSITLHDKDDSNQLPRIHNNHSFLPTIYSSELSTPSRFRRVDFNHQRHKNSISNSSSSTWQSSLIKKRSLKKLQLTSTETLPDTDRTQPINFDLSSQQNSYRNRLITGNLRPILRKTIHSSPITDNNSEKDSGQMSIPSSAISDDVPLGTKSQRLFGGSECFAEIMNELEQQNKNI